MKEFALNKEKYINNYSSTYKQNNRLITLENLEDEIDEGLNKPNSLFDNNDNSLVVECDDKEYINLQIDQDDDICDSNN